MGPLVGGRNAASQATALTDLDGRGRRRLDGLGAARRTGRCFTPVFHGRQAGGR